MHRKGEWLVTKVVITGCVVVKLLVGVVGGGVNMHGNEVMDWSDVKFICSR